MEKSGGKMLGKKVGGEGKEEKPEPCVA